MKRILYIAIFILFYTSINASNSGIPSFTITGINTKVNFENIPSTFKTVTLTVKGKNFKKEYKFKVNKGKVDTSLVFHNAGTMELILNIPKIKATQIRVIPGWLSLIPPLLAIFLALLIRQVVISLAAGVYLGAIFIYNYNPLIGFLRFIDTISINALANHDHIVIIVFTLLFGGVIGVIANNGGTVGISKIVVKFAKTARSGLIATWIMGILVFFDDYANALIVGNMMRPITDKLKISREKLSYIVDSTAAPVASVFIISSWIGFELGLIQAGLHSIGSTQNAYDLFLQTIPFRFYSIATLFFVFIISYMNRDFGSMFKAEKRARVEGKLYGKLSAVTELEDEMKNKFRIEDAKWYNAVVPIAILIFGTIAGLIYTGILSLENAGMVHYTVRNIISHSDSFLSLLWASFIASVVAIAMSVWQKILTLNESIDAWSKGIQSMLFAGVILVFAWAISSVTSELKTADYIILLLKSAIDPRFLPVLVFFICALISFSTGTSWGTMAIIMPIVIPLTYKMSLVANLSPATATIIMNDVVGGVLAGSVFGDHCSPISDTTILSSIASRCNHIDHVRTQLPYAVLVAVVSMILGSIPTAFGLSPYYSLLLIGIVLTIILYFFGKKVPKRA